MEYKLKKDKPEQTAGVCCYKLENSFSVYNNKYVVLIDGNDTVYEARGTEPIIREAGKKNKMIDFDKSDSYVLQTKIPLSIMAGLEARGLIK